jgi:hypothetical protein
LPIREIISATVTSLAFNPLGTRLAIGFEDGRFTAWDMARGEMVFEPVDAGDASVERLAFDSQGDTLVVLLADGSLKRYPLADLASGMQNPAGWTRPALGTKGAALASDGHSWAIGLDTGAIMLGRTGGPPPLDAYADAAALIEQACRIANRNLYPAEWSLLIGDTPYETTCPAASGESRQ